MAGEVFYSGKNTMVVKRNSKSVPGHNRRINGKTPLQSPDHRVIRVYIEIYNRRKIQVYSQTGNPREA
jgi:hypothetical protein